MITNKNTNYYSSWKGKILRKWDWWIYCKAVGSLRRMSTDNPGMSYLMQLQMQGWNEQLKISPALKQSTQTFFDSMQQYPKP